MVLQPQHTGSLVAEAPRQPVFHRAVSGGGHRGTLLHGSLPGGLPTVVSETPRSGSPEPAVVVLRVRRFRVAKVRKSAQSFKNPSHEIPKRSQRFPPSKSSGFIFLLLSLCRLGFHSFSYLVFLAGIHGSST